MNRLSTISLSFLAALSLGAAAPQAPAPKAAPQGGLRFTDATAAAGLKFTHNSGRSGKKYMPETLGSGVALFDADGDGWLDVLFVNSRDWQSKGRKSFHALYRNNRN
ncbi:MAG TPA: CRTAC1 family protein, partial [Thermoanaerobaculia bacterium]|nr:CRTAC1 family protein [Thermoanaerobaculia bacterium]